MKQFPLSQDISYYLSFLGGVSLIVDFPSTGFCWCCESWKGEGSPSREGESDKKINKDLKKNNARRRNTDAGYHSGQPIITLAVKKGCNHSKPIVGLFLTNNSPYTKFHLLKSDKNTVLNRKFSLFVGFGLVGQKIAVAISSTFYHVFCPYKIAWMKNTKSESFRSFWAAAP